MQQRKQHTAFAVDGYAITASFADCKNAAALHHVKQILLSSFANNHVKQILLSSFANNSVKIAPAASLQSLPNREIIHLPGLMLVRPPEAPRKTAAVSSAWLVFPSFP